MKRKIINNVQITYKIAAGYMIMLLVILFTSYIAYASISELNVYMRDMYFNRLLSLDYLLEADRDLQQLLVAERSMMVPHDDQKLYKIFLSDYEENKQQSETRVNKYKALPRIAKEKTIIEEYEQKRSEWEELSRTLMKRVASQDPEQKAVAMDLSMNKAKITFEEMRDKLDKLEEINLEQAEEKISEGARLFKQSLFIFAASIAFSVTLICMLAFIIIRNIKGRIRSVNSIVQDLADGEGDLTVRIQDLGLDEFRVLGNNLNIFMDKLETVVRSIFTSSVNLDGISQEVVSGNSKLSVSTQQMAGNIEEIAASIEEIVSSIKNTAGGVVNMTENILSIAETAEKSSETFGSLNTTMTGLQNAGKEINSIIDVVNGIAFQTNLLALNASVEAAHAGDEGKGFAVVASEVRNLAIRSTEAGKRIKELVEQNDEQIRVMSEITQSSVESIENILNKVYETKKHVHQIENMSREQSTGIEQISLAMNQIDQGVQENAAQVDKQTTVSDNMIMIAQELSNNVKKFKISEKI